MGVSRQTERESGKLRILVSGHVWIFILESFVEKVLGNQMHHFS